MIKYYGLGLLSIVFSQLDIWFSFYFLSFLLSVVLFSLYSAFGCE